MANEFRLTHDHLKLLRRATVGWCGDEYGAPEIDPKRPYGNSDVSLDVADLLGWPVPVDGEGHVDYEGAAWDALCDRARRVHLETQTALQIVVLNAGNQATPGLYRQTDEYDRHSWARVGD
jgi:hypothetical protein